MKFEQFEKYLKLYQQSLLLEGELNKLGIELNPEKGILNLFDEFISFIPDLMFNEKGAQIFWDNINYDFSKESIEELWNKVENYIIF